MGGAHKGIQAFIEDRAEGPAFALAAACMVLRAASFYSGGAIVLSKLLGPRGLTIFNGASGVGLAVGAELLASIAGRQWQRYVGEIRETEGRRGLTRIERRALIRHYKGKARLSFTFMAAGLLASAAAAFSFLQSASGAHSLAADISELFIVLLLLSIISYLGIFKEASADDPTEVATTHARAARSKVVEAAGKRLADGSYTRADAMVIAASLPRQEREKFLSATLGTQADDPLWTVADILAWLGVDSSTAKRQVTRKLAKLAIKGEMIAKDQDGRYVLPRSLVATHFAEDFRSIASGERYAPTARVARYRVPSEPTPSEAATTPGQSRPGDAVEYSRASVRPVRGASNSQTGNPAPGVLGGILGGLMDRGVSVLSQHLAESESGAE